jgi:hypothetical protein
LAIEYNSLKTYEVIKMTQISIYDLKNSDVPFLSYLHRDEKNKLVAATVIQTLGIHKVLGGAKPGPNGEDCTGPFPRPRPEST